MTNSLTEEDQANLERLEKQLVSAPKGRGALIPLLQKAQTILGYLPDEALSLVAGHLAINRSDVYGVASFYNQFRFTPPGKNPVKVSDQTNFDGVRPRLRHCLATTANKSHAQGQHCC